MVRARFVVVAVAACLLAGALALDPGTAGAVAGQPSALVETERHEAHAGVRVPDDLPCCAGDDDVAAPGWSQVALSASVAMDRTTASGTWSPSAEINGQTELALGPDGELRRLDFRGTGAARATGTQTPRADASAYYRTNLYFRVLERSEYEITGDPSTGNGQGIDICHRLTGRCPLVTHVNAFEQVQPTGTLEPGLYWLNLDALTEARSAAETIAWDLTLTVRSLSASAAWDWRTAPRYGADANGDGKVDSFTPDGTLDVTPSAFPVELAALECPADGFTRRWVVDGTVVGTGCNRTQSFPAEGAYDVGLEVLDPSGTPVAAQYHQVTVNDILVVSIGDSVASGEGAPERIAAGPGGWQNEQCHRSALAGPARAAAAIEAADPRSTVTFVHLACSGATVDRGLLGSYEGVVPGPPLPAQVDQLVSQVGGREVDALTISIGANDVGFSTLVQLCFVHPSCDTDTPGSARRLFDQRLAQLPAAYDRLAAALVARGIGPGRVHLTTYFDAMRDEAGAPCDQEVLEENLDLPLVGISADEAAWASDDLIPRLNAAGSAAAARHGWRHVTGVAEDFRTHGYCSSSGWVTQLSESQFQQGDINGTLHPNRTGHDSSYRPRLAASIGG